RTPAGPPGGPLLARRLEDAAPQEHALQVRRRDLVAERRGVEVAELGDREGRRREREAEVRVRELRAEPGAAGERHAAVVEGECGEGVHRKPRCVGGELGIRVARDEAEKSGRELPLARMTGRVAQALEPLEVGEL